MEGISEIKISGSRADVRDALEDVADALEEPASEVEVGLALARLRLAKIRQLRDGLGGE